MKINYIWLFLFLLALAALIKVLYERKNEIIGSLGIVEINYQITEGLITHSLKKPGYKYIDHYMIIYSYQVNNEIYSSSVVDYSGDYANVDLYLHKYPKGKRVEVFFWQDDPSFSVLEPNKKGFALFRMPLFLVLFVGFGFYMSFSLKNPS